MNGGAGLGKLGRERVRERGERVVEFPGVLMCAKERSGGSVLAGPRRRRGGSREELLGGVAKGGEVQREEGGR